MTIYSRSPEIDPESKEFAAFADAVRVLSPAQGRDVRARFHDTFLDTNSETYRERNMRVFIYDRNLRRNQHGLLWECLRSYRRATWDQIKSAMEGSREVIVLFYVFNAPPDSPDQGYGPFKRDDVITCRPGYLDTGLPYLPDDLYVFDRSFKWAGVLTHEPWVEGIEPHKFLVLAQDPLHSLISTGDHWRFVPIASSHRQDMRDAVEMWLDDRHFVDLVQSYAGGQPALRFQPPRVEWIWEVPLGKLQRAIDLALKELGHSDTSHTPKSETETDEPIA